MLWERFRFFHCLKNKVLEGELWCGRRDDIVYKHEKGHLLGAQGAMATACLATNEVLKLICRIISSVEFLHPDLFLLDTAVLRYYACIILSPRSSSSLSLHPTCTSFLDFDTLPVHIPFQHRGLSRDYSFSITETSNIACRPSMYNNKHILTKPLLRKP